MPTDGSGSDTLFDLSNAVRMADATNFLAIFNVGALVFDTDPVIVTFDDDASGANPLATAGKIEITVLVLV